MNISIRATINAIKGSPAPRSRLMNVKKWGEDTRLGDLLGLSTRPGYEYVNGGSDFMHIDYFNPMGPPGSRVAGMWGAVSKFWEVGRDVWRYFIDCQPPGNITAKINWLIGSTADSARPERPCWRTDADGLDQWVDGSSSLQVGTSVFGGNKIRIKTDSRGFPLVTEFYTSYPGPYAGVKQWIKFYQVDGIKPAQMQRDAAGLFIHNPESLFDFGYIQQATGANIKPAWDTFAPLPNGELIYYPVLDPDYFPCNVNGFRHSLYIPEVAIY